MDVFWSTHQRSESAQLFSKGEQNFILIIDGICRPHEMQVFTQEEGGGAIPEERGQNRLTCQKRDELFASSLYSQSQGNSAQLLYAVQSQLEYN